jgi:hypothetical protein
MNNKNDTHPTAEEQRAAIVILAQLVIEAVRAKKEKSKPLPASGNRKPKQE